MSIEDPLLVNDVNVRGTINMLELARKLNAKRFVFSSSAAVYGDPEEMPVHEHCSFNPLSPYAASKVAAEMYVNAYSASYDIDSCILRYFNVYGPRQTYSEYSGVISIFINQALKDEPITIDGDGEQTRSFVHVSDVVRATILAGEQRTAIGATINVSGTELISINRISQIVKEQAKQSKSPIVHGPPRIGDVKDSIGSIEQAQKILGFTPEVPLDGGLQETIEWYRANL
jgi:UDP-glucose 4-epimerase